MTEIGKEFHKETCYVRGKIPRVRLDWTHEPKRYKEYEGAKKIKLPLPQKRGGAPLWDVIKKRRSIRKYKDKKMNIRELSQLLWATQGITERNREFRATPSAGGLYPIVTYVVVNNVETIDAGLYHYDVKKHELQLVDEGDKREPVTRAALDQRMAYNAPVVFVWSSIFQRSVWKYSERAHRYVYMDVGHIGQSMVTAATALGLGSCLIGALYDEEANELIGVDGEKESVIYMCTVGYSD